VIGQRAALRRLLSLAAASVSLASCAVSDPTQYYTLGEAGAGSARSGVSGSAKSSASPPGSLTGNGAEAIGVGPVIVPGYLDRIQIVTRAGADQVELSPFHRWAEPLDDGIARVLAEEIGARVPTERIVTYPWRGVVARVIQYQVVVAVLRFDGRPAGDVTLDTRWRILGRDGAELAFGRSTVTETAAGPGFVPLVTAMTRALLVLGQEIAAKIRELPR
jgi:uncharacterized lipoprotein YmbA